MRSTTDLRRSGRRGAHRSSVGLALGVVVALAAWTWATPRAQAPDSAAGLDAGQAIIARALDLMGGNALRNVERVRLDMMTQWQRTAYRDVPWTDRPSFESHVDIRDYTISGWRNTRDFGARTIVNVVRDTVATTDLGNGFRPQSVAYVDERDELFLYTPDRLILHLSGSAGLRSAGDTIIGGERHALVRAVVRDNLPVTVAFHAGSGLPTLLRFRRGHDNDFGLVPFGEMEVAVWYSNWASFGSVSIPTQWDIMRAGAPYKRMTVRSAAFDPVLAADSFAVSDDLRASFLADRRPMHDRPVDTVTVVRPGLVRVQPFGYPEGAVRVGGEWVLIQAGHHPLPLSRGRDALAREGVDPIAAALVAMARAGNGGAAALVDEGIAVHTSVAADPFLDAVLQGAGVRRRNVTVVRGPTAIRLSGGELLLEPLDLPDVPGSLVAYAPAQRWLYVPDAATSLDVRYALERAAGRGWAVDGVGTSRALWMDVPPAGTEGSRR